MACTTYELGLNWPHGRAEGFVAEIERAARRRRIRWICVGREQAERVRRRIDRRTMKIGLFLNTQADGVNMQRPDMLLCRSLKAAGSFVVEDPDDAAVYADRALQISYLERAGLAVPPYVVVPPQQHEHAPVPRAQRAKLGANWVARPAVGMGSTRHLLSRARHIAPALKKAGFAPGIKLLVQKAYPTVQHGARPARVRMWHLFGWVVPAWAAEDPLQPRRIGADEWARWELSDLAVITRRIATITGLDWFVSEFLFVGSGNRRKALVTEPANALAGLGPGLNPHGGMPADVARIAADRIAETAWRLARQLDLDTGVNLRLAAATANEAGRETASYPSRRMRPRTNTSPQTMSASRSRTARRPARAAIR